MSDELPLYQIANWNQHFENNKSRQRDKCGFVCVPNKHGGQGLTAVLNCGPGIEGVATYGTWVLIVEYLSRQMAPREGFLTADGTRDGMRLCIAELARMLKAPPAHVRKTLSVVCSIGWMRLVEGKPETAPRSLEVTAEVPPEVTADMSTVSASDRPSDRENGTKSVLNADIERKKEGKKEPPSVPQGGTGVNGPKDLTHEELKSWINSLFGRQRAWSYEEERLLTEIAPVSKEDRALLSWAYTLPRDEKGWALVDGNPTSKRKENVLSLLQAFSSEIDKWSGWRTGEQNDYEQEHEQERENEEWTDERRQAFRELFPDVSISCRFNVLAEDVRRQIDDHAKEAVAA